jgi:hypothetical protein
VREEVHVARTDEVHTRFWWRNLNERDHMAVGVYFEDNIKTDVKEIGSEDVNWIDFAQNRDKWPILLNAPMNLRVP